MRSMAVGLFSALATLAGLGTLAALAGLPSALREYAREPEDVVGLLITAAFAGLLCFLWGWAAWSGRRGKHSGNAPEAIRHWLLGAVGIALVSLSPTAGVDALPFALIGLTTIGSALADWRFSRGAGAPGTGADAPRRSA
jgi:hypothetical protein